MDAIKIRPNTLDWAKSIGMLCVILGHYVYYFNIPYRVDSLEWKIAHFVTLFHMPLFFIISGILFKKKDSIKSELLKIVKTLLIPYFLISIIDGVIYYIFFIDEESLNFKHIIQYIIGIFCGGDLYGKVHIYPAGPIWFLYSLFIIKTMALCVYNKKTSTIILMILSILIMFTNKNFLPFKIDSSFSGFFFFMIGFLFKDYWFKLINSKISTNLLPLIMSTTIIIVLYAIYENMNVPQGFSININYYSPIPPLFIISGVAGTCMIISISKILSHLKIQPIYVFSVGMIVPLGFQKIIMLTLYAINPYFQRTTAVVLTILISYVFILMISKYIPILIGGRGLKQGYEK